MSLEAFKPGWLMCMSEEQVQQAVSNLAATLNSRYCSTGQQRPVEIVAILKGVFMLLADLARQLKFPYRVHFVRVRSYNDQQRQTTEISGIDFNRDLDQQAQVLILDELWDTGAIIDAVRKEVLQTRIVGASVSTCALLAKTRSTSSRYQTRSQSIMYSFPNIVAVRDIPRVWLVGYGLDDKGEKRGWSDLWFVPKPLGAQPSEDDIIFTDPAEYLRVCQVITNQLDCDRQPLTQWCNIQ